MLRLVVGNLLPNAVKHTRTRNRAVIGVGSTHDGEETVLFVGDNCLRFDIEYKEKHYEVF